MSAKNIDKTVTEVNEQTSKGEPKFKLEKLRENSVQLFHVTTSTFDGAMFGNTLDEMTINEAKNIINKWLGRKE
jgi:hypothetical protein